MTDVFARLGRAVARRPRTAVLVWVLLAVVACTAIFSGKPARRKAAYDVLLVLTRARRRPQLPYGDPPPRLPGPRRGRG